MTASLSSPDGPTYVVVDITPEVALDYLTHNTHNRAVRTRTVSAYAADMSAGVWRQNGECIKRAVDGTLLDGQHRLLAIIESGTTQRMLVVGNLPLDYQETVDGGIKRSFSDILKLRGETNCSNLAAVTRRVLLWNLGDRPGHGNLGVTTAQLLATLEQNPDLRYSAQIAAEVRRFIPIHASILGMCHWLFNRIDFEDCADFFERLKEGNDLPSGHPLTVLRRTVISNMTSKSRLSETVMVVYVIKTWNAYRSGDTMGILRYKPGGAHPETFPEPK